MIPSDSRVLLLSHLSHYAVQPVSQVLHGSIVLCSFHQCVGHMNAAALVFFSCALCGALVHSYAPHMTSVFT